MADNIINAKIREAHDTEANWIQSNPILLKGQLAYSSDKYGYYKVGDGSQTWEDLSYVKAVDTISKKDHTLVLKDTEDNIISHVDLLQDDVRPLVSKTYTGIVAAANNQAEGTFYFATILPDSYSTMWHVRFRTYCYVPGQILYQGSYISDIWGKESTYIVQKDWNSIWNTSYRPMYYHTVYFAKSAGITNGYGHALGECLWYQKDPTASGYARTFNIDILEADHCTVEMFEQMLTYAHIPGTGSTNYNGISNLDACNNGLQESGDANTYDRIIMSNNTLFAGANGIYGQQIVMRDESGTTWSSVTTAYKVSTDHTRNPIGFHPEKLYWYSSGTTINSGGKTGTSTCYEAYVYIDFRYSSNCGTTLTPGHSVYLKGYINNGLFYLDDTTWWTQTLPSSDDGNVYIYVGEAISSYQVSFPTYHPIYWYKNGKVCEYNEEARHALTATDASRVNNHTVDADVPSNAKFTDTTYTAATAAPGKISTNSSVGTSTNYARQDHTHGIDLATGDSNGQVKIAGTNISVKGLAALAYKDSLAKADVGLGNVDNKSSETIRSEITSGNVTSALGYTPVNKAGDTMSSTLTISKAGETGVAVENTSKSHKVELLVGSSGNGGIYDRTKSKWVVYSDTSGNVTLNGNANTATTATTATNVSTTAGSVNSARHIWFSDSSYETRRNHDDDFTYNPNTNVLTVGQVNGSATLTGTPTAPTAALGTNTTQIATTEFVNNQISDLKVSGRNLLKDSHKTVSTGDYLTATYYLGNDAPAEGEIVTLQVKGQLASTKSYWQPYNSGAGKHIPGLRIMPADYNADTGIYTVTGAWSINGAANTYLNFYAMTSSQSGVSQIEWVKLERGYKATDWSPAPEDVVTSLSVNGKTVTYKNYAGTSLGTITTQDTTYTAATAAPGKVATSSSTGTSTNYARQDHTHGIDLATGDANGQVKIAGTNVSVKGLGALAYKDSLSASDITSGVTGVKGDTESTYRTGNVNLTPANIGAVAKNDTLLTTNPFAPSSLRGPYISKIDNAFYCAHKRWTVTATNTSGVSNLFDGSYEGAMNIASGNTSVITMDFSSEPSGYFPGYPYGYIYISFYYTAIPKSVTGRVYCNYSQHGIGWHDISFSLVPGSTDSNMTYVGRQGVYNISKLEITIVARDSGNTAVTEMEMKLDRPYSGRTPFLSKYQAETLYYDLTAPKFIGALNGNADTATNASKVNDHTVNADVPSGAKFTDTTYTFATGDANGQIKVTPLGGNAQNVSVKGLGALAYKESLGKADVGLGNVDNTQDLNKPISTATQAALDGKSPLAGSSSLTTVANQLTFGDSKFQIITSSVAGGTNKAVGWYRLFKLGAYSSGMIYNHGGYNTGWPTNAVYAIATSHLIGSITQLAGRLKSIFNQVRIIRTSGGEHYLDAYQSCDYQSGGSMSAQFFTFIGTCNTPVEALNPTSVIDDSTTPIATCEAKDLTNGFLPLAGGTMTGTLTAKPNVYTDSYTGALNMGNSNIYGVNSIYTADASENAGEGIHFYRDATHVDTLWMNGGDLLFVPNRALGTSTTKANSQKVGRFTANPTDDKVVVTDGTTGGMNASTVTTTELGYVSGVTSSIQTQLNAKAPLASPALTGTPTAPTATTGTNTTQIATTAFVKTAVDNLINDAPEAYDTLKEISDYISSHNTEYEALLAITSDKQDKITGAATSITQSNLTANRALISDSSGKVAVSGVTSTELGYLNGVTSSIQTQLNGKSQTQHNHDTVYLKLAGGTLTGGLTFPANKYKYDNTFGIDMKNSDIVGVNSIYTTDLSDDAREGIHFYRDSTHYDTLWVKNGDILFTPNRTITTSTSAADSQKVARFIENPTNNKLVVSSGTSGGLNVIEYIGGRNYLLSTKDLSSPWKSESGGTITFDSNVGMYKVEFAAKSSSRWGIYQDVNIEPNTQYTFSCVVLKQAKIGCGMAFYDGAPNSWPQSDVQITTEGKQVIHITKTSGETSAKARIYLHVYPTADDKYGYFYLPKLEKQIISTDWSPNPDDYERVVTGGAQTITSSDLTASRALVSNSSGKVAVSDVTSTELGYLDGVTSAIQTQLNGKQASITGGATTITSSNLTASRALISNSSGKVAVSDVTSTELGYLDGVTSAIQTQLNGKQAQLGYTPVDKAGDTMTGNLVVPKTRIANTYYGVSFGRTTSTPKETLFHTGIKWVSGAHMPVIHITGYAYGLQSPVEFKIGFYIYAGNIGYCGAVNMGQWNPEIYLFKRTVNETEYVSVAFVGQCYFLQLSADVQDEMGKFGRIDLTDSLWSWEFLTTTGNVPAADSGVTCIKVPYKADILNPSKVNGHTVASNVPANAVFTDTTALSQMTGVLDIAHGGTNASDTLTALNNLGAPSIGDIGTTIPQDADLNTYITPGTYSVISGSITSSLSNCPFNSSAFKMFVTYSYSTSVIYQFVVGYNYHHILWRSTSNGGSTWTDWYHQAMIKNGSAVGSSTNPVYVSNTGVITRLLYTIEKSVPSDAVFTDTTNLTQMTGTLSVGHGGTGATSFTSGELLIGNGSNAIGTRSIKNITTKGNLGWTSSTTDVYIPTINTLAYWNGRFNATAQNLTYCVKGEFGDLAVKNSLGKSDVGLGNVDNTSDVNKPISSATQSALDGKQATITGAATSITQSNLTASRALVSDSSGKVAASNVSSTELGYLSGVTSSIQTQLDAKQQTLDYTPVNKAGDTMTGTLIVNGGSTTARIWSGVNSSAVSHTIGADSNSGNIYLYATGNANGDGNRGLYTNAHGTGSAKDIIRVDTNNDVTFFGSLSGAAQSNVLKTGDTMSGDLRVDNRIWAGADSKEVETDVGARSKSGGIYLYQVGNADGNGNRGIWITSHGTGSGTSVIEVDTNNNTTFRGNLNGGASKVYSTLVNQNNGTANGGCIHFDTSFSNSSSGYYDLRHNDSLGFWYRGGKDSSADGYAILQIGNATSHVASNGTRGYIRLYGRGANFTTISTEANGANQGVTFPNCSGTVYTTGNLQFVLSGTTLTITTS